MKMYFRGWECWNEAVVPCFSVHLSGWGGEVPLHNTSGMLRINVSLLLSARITMLRRGRMLGGISLK